MVGNGDVDDAPNGHKIRVISIYATRWSRKWERRAGSNHLELGRLEEFFGLFDEQLPCVLARKSHRPEDVTFTSSTEAVRPHNDQGRARSQINELTIARAESWLFALPSDQVVAALDIDFQSLPLESDATQTINALEHGAYAELQVDGLDLEAHIANLAQNADATEIDKSTLLPPERHQIVFASPAPCGQKPSEETIALILYRSDPPYRPEFMKVRLPSGLNEGNAIGAVTPYVSLLYGHPEFVKNSVFLTVVQAVGTSARFRQIWHRAHGRVRDFRYEGQKREVGTQDKAAMEFLADDLGNLELDLSFSVEASADLGLLIPLVRIESFHKELYAAMELRQRAETVSRMFSRLDASIRSELTAIDIREQQDSERKRLHRGAAISVLAVIGAPLSFFLGFFGISAQQVNSSWSIWDYHHYLLVYLTAGCVAITPLVVFLILNRRAWRHSRHEKKFVDSGYWRKVTLRSLSGRSASCRSPHPPAGELAAPALSTASEL